jgi:hypothetical protein
MLLCNISEASPKKSKESIRRHLTVIRVGFLWQIPMSCLNFGSIRTSTQTYGIPD